MPEQEPIASASEIVPEAAEAAETVEVREKAKETPVLDVHVPHATHTWKDFFIHIAAITVNHRLWTT